jgi:hypothetical protein
MPLFNMALFCSLPRRLLMSLLVVLIGNALHPS